MVNNVQSKIKTLSNEVKKLAGLILEEKASAENQTSTSSDIVRHKLPHMWEKSAQSLTDDE